MISNEDFLKMKKEVQCAIDGNYRIDGEATRFNIDAVNCLYDQTMVKRFKLKSKLWEDKTDDILRRVSLGQSLVDTAVELKINSYKIAKIFLESQTPPLQVSKFLHDTLQIHDFRIRNELLCCISDDPVCSHEHNQLQECIGKEYEEKLVENLRVLNLCFETESELRARGKPKTPDILFLIPMRVTIDPDRTGDQPRTHIINWIDSKAMFATADTYQEHVEQFKAYSNRYGHGMVIYWYGYVENVVTLAGADNVVVAHRIPDLWVFPTGECVSNSPEAKSPNH